MDFVIPRRSTFIPSIVACTILKVENYEGSYDRKAKKFKKVKQEYQKQRCANFKIATNGLEVFVNAPWASFCAMDVSSNIKLRLLLMHNYCNQLVTFFSRFLTDT